MKNANEESQTSREKYRKAQALIVENLNLNSQTKTPGRYSIYEKENWKFKFKL